MTDKNELIQRYFDQTITEEQLHEFQELLKNDPSVRSDLLLYSRLDIAIRDYVLFHDYMDDPGVRDRDNTEKTAPEPEPKTATEAELVDRLLRNIFPDRRIAPAF